MQDILLPNQYLYCACYLCCTAIYFDYAKDIANLKAIAKQLQDLEALPLDYYTVFAELEKQLAEEFDFVAEAAAMERIYASLLRSADGLARTEPPLVIPRVVRGLVSRRVLVMDYLHGVPLSRAREEMEKRNIDPDSPEAKLFARKLLSGLTTVFGRNILVDGFFHAGKFSPVATYISLSISLSDTLFRTR